MSKKSAPAQKRAAAKKVLTKKPASSQKPPSAAQKLQSFGMDAICVRTADGVPQRTIAAEIGVSWATLMAWIDAEPQRIEQYAHAREAQADKLAEDLLAIADEIVVEAKYQGEDVSLDVSSAAVARNRLRVDARKWLASKMAPKKYGDKMQIGGADDLPPVQTASVHQLSEQDLIRIASAGMKSADARKDGNTA